MRAVVAALLALSLAVPAAPAQAAPRKQKPRLAVTSLVIPAGRAALDPGQPVRLRGRIVNRGSRTRRVVLSFALRSQRSRRGTAYRLGARNVLSVSGHSARRFRAVGLARQVPLGRPLHVSACARRVGARRSRCRITRRTLVFVEPQRPLTPVPRPSPEPTPSPAPTSPPSAVDSGPRPGARSAGDRLFPAIGNGGYDVRHYDIELSYDPPQSLLLGTTAIEAVATQSLSEYSFDLVTMDVATVKVGDAEAAFRQEDGKLIVTPPAPISEGATFTTTVAHGGQATPYQDPDGSYEGFLPTEDGAYVVNEPVGAMSWFPCNNVPTDKALYDLRLTVPAVSTVFGNGRLQSTESSGTQTTWHWREDRPMASYLVTATNGVFQRSTDTSDPELPFEYGIDPKVPAAQTALPTLELSPGIVDFLADTLDAPYPFTSSGGVADAPPSSLATAAYALESQTRPMYPLIPPLSPSDTTVAHELAHQWFGDSVSPAQWADIWLNEGPAEFYSWLWDERENDGPTTAEQFDQFYGDADFDWSVPPANPEADEIFNTDAMYNRGAMVLEALRQILGEQKFLELNRAWLSEHAYSHASTADWIALFVERGGADPAQLGVFFDEWLYGTERPGITPGNFETYVP